MPKQWEIPEALRPLLRRNGIELSDARWAHDVDRLWEALPPTAPDQPETAEDGPTADDGATPGTQEPDLRAEDDALIAAALEDAQPEGTETPGQPGTPGSLATGTRLRPGSAVGRTNAWIAHQLDVSAEDIRTFKGQNG